MQAGTLGRVILSMVCVGATLVGCGRAASTPAPLPTDAPATELDLNGRWVYGSADEPAAGPVTGCYPARTLVFASEGNAVQSRVENCGGPCYQEESLRGQAEDGEVTLTGFVAPAPGVGGAAAQVRYRLTWDAATGHLRGTRDDQPFWAAPLLQGNVDDCGPAPL